MPSNIRQQCAFDVALIKFSFILFAFLWWKKKNYLPFLISDNDDDDDDVFDNKDYDAMRCNVCFSSSEFRFACALSRLKTIRVNARGRRGSATQKLKSIKTRKSRPISNDIK